MGQEDMTRVRSILLALGDGGTTDMARRVAEWMNDNTELTGIPLDRIVGLSEVAEFLGRNKQTVCNWMARGQHNCPAPFKELRATKLFDLDQWRVWAIGHPELIKTDTGVRNG